MSYCMRMSKTSFNRAMGNGIYPEAGSKVHIPWEE